MMFSIIIPVYNVEPYLRECLDSVLAQTFTDWECLCVDDGSTDASGTILDEYSAKDFRFRVFHQENGGVSSARNLALDNARGEWVWFVDGDDVIHPNSLGIFHDAIQMHPGTCTVFLSYCEGTILPDEWPDTKTELPLVYPEPCSAGLARFGMGMGSYVMRRVSIGSLRFEPFPRGEDSVFMMAYVRNGFGFIDLRRKLYFYRQRVGSATHVIPTAEMVLSNFKCQRRQMENFAESIACLGNPKADNDWKAKFDVCYRTYYGMYFRLSAQDRRRLLGHWISLLELAQTHYRPPVEMRIRIGLIRVTRSGLFVRWLAFGRIPGLNRLGRILRATRRLFSP